MSLFNPLDHPVCFAQPRLIAPSAWISHVPFAMYLVDILRPEILVELGTHHGVSYCAFCQAADELGLSARFYAVDTWKGDPQTGFYGPEVLAGLRGHHDPLYGSFSRLLQSTFDEALEHFDDGSIDLLHIDGMHTYEAVKHDFDNWLPKMSERGVVLLHDTNVREGDFGVWKLWDEQVEEYEGFQFVHGHGLGLLCMGDDVPEDVSTFTNLADADLRRFRGFFFQLGSRWERELTLRTMGKGIAEEEEPEESGEGETGPSPEELQLRRELDEMTLTREKLREKNLELREHVERVEETWNEELHRHKHAEAVLEAERVSAEASMREAQSELAYMKSTRSWRLIASWWRLREWLIPPGSSRLRLYYLVRTGFGVLFSRGPVALVRRMAAWVRGQRRNPPELAEVPEVEGDEGPGVVATEADEAKPDQQALPTETSASRPAFTSARDIKVLYVATQAEFISKKYRVFDVQERLRRLGVEADVMYDVHLSARRKLVPTYDIVVFSRLPMTPLIRGIIDEAREAGTLVAFEVDDYVFDPAMIQYVDAIRDFSEDEYLEYADGVRRYRELLEYCDCAIVSTEFLADIVRGIGQAAYVIPNGVNHAQVELAEEALQHREEGLNEEEAVRIGYLSGTATHRADFAVAVPALRRILEDFPQVLLDIRGYLQIPEELQEFEDRIERNRFVHWKELVGETAKLDIAIAPLEYDNPYARAKSALKYLEPALVEVPVVAANCEAYASAIDHGRTGFLAGNEEEWYEALAELVKDQALRRRIGKAAREDVLETYAPEALSEETLEVFGEMLFDIRGVSAPVAVTAVSLRLNWVTSSPFPGSGGHRSVIRTAELLHQRGHEVAVHFIDDGQFTSARQIQNFVHENFMDTSFQYTFGTNTLSSADAFIATTWMSAIIVHQKRDLARQGYYFVQDFEPFFFQMGNDYVIAEQTYRLGLRHITLGPWLTRKLREDYGAQADYFQFPISHEIYNPQVQPLETPSEAKRVLFFARPEMPRRCYPLGLHALSILKQQSPVTEIALFGSAKIDSRTIPFEHTNLGVFSDLNELARLHGSADVGVVFSTTNPSWMPLEMMACGCPVVEMDNEINRFHYGKERPATLVGPDPGAIAGGILKLLQDEELRQAKIEAGLKFVKDFPTLDQSISRIEELLVSGLQDSQGQ